VEKTGKKDRNKKEGNKKEDREEEEKRKDTSLCGMKMGNEGKKEKKKEYNGKRSER